MEIRYMEDILQTGEIEVLDAVCDVGQIKTGGRVTGGTGDRPHD